MKEKLQKKLEGLAQEKEQVVAQANELAKQSDQAAVRLFAIAGAEEALRQLLEDIGEEENTCENHYSTEDQAENKS